MEIKINENVDTEANNDIFIVLSEQRLIYKVIQVTVYFAEHTWNLRKKIALILAMVFPFMQDKVPIQISFFFFVFSFITWFDKRNDSVESFVM